MWFELLLGFLEQISEFSRGLMVLSIIGMIISIAVYVGGSDDNIAPPNIKEGLLGIGKKAFKICFIVLLITIPLRCIPKIDDLWRIRVSLIKLYIVSPENLDKTVDHVDRIAKRLECKYLGACEEEKK